MNNWLTATLLAGTAVLGGTLEAGKMRGAEKELRSRIEAFRNAGDTRDVGEAEKILHKDFRLLAYFGDAAEPLTMDKAGYSGALSAGKIGGSKRELTIVAVEVSGKNASCHLRMRSKELTFDNYMHWVLTSQGWQLLNDLTHAVPQKK